MRRKCRERFPRHQLHRKPLVSDPGMHHGTCVTHVPWCMSESITRGGGKNVPGIPGACATRNFTYLARGPLRQIVPGSQMPCDTLGVDIYSMRTWNGEMFTYIILKYIFFTQNVSIVIWFSLKFVPRDLIHNTSVSIGSGNGLAPNRRKAIAWTNDDTNSLTYTKSFNQRTVIKIHKS